MKMRTVVLVVTVFSAATSIATADFWSRGRDRLKRTVKQAGRTIEEVHKLPIKNLESIGKVASGDSSSEIIEPYRKIGRLAGGTVSDAVTLVNSPQVELQRKVNQFAAQTGPAGRFVFDVAMFNRSYLTQYAEAGGQAFANLLRGENPLQVSAVPLAAAIRAAREKHLSESSPIPRDVVAGLTNFFPQQTLTRARYAIGTVEITLPNFIGQGARFMGKGYAVVVDDIIVFNRQPPAFDDNPHWWTHEMTHVDQYRRFGVENFAYKYMKDAGGSIEGEADANGERRTGRGRSVFADIRLSESQIGVRTNLPFEKGSDGVARAVSETFTHQCVFPNDEGISTILITNTSKIIMLDPIWGDYWQIGWVTAPLPGSDKSVVATYQSEMGPAAIRNNNTICIWNGGWQVIATINKI